MKKHLVTKRVIFFFTGGAEKNIFDDGYTVGAGLKYKFADGGIAGLRQGYPQKAKVLIKHVEDF